MPGKKLTEEDKLKFFQKMVELEKDPYMRQRYIRQWHEGKLKIYKKRGRICLESPPDLGLMMSLATGIQVVEYDKPWKVLTEEERKKIEQKNECVEKEGNLVHFGNFNGEDN